MVYGYLGTLIYGYGLLEGLLMEMIALTKAN